jgi:hypothetical protein
MDLSPCLLSADGSFDTNDEPGILNPCSWMDAGHTLCSNLSCVAVIPLDELVEICFHRKLASPILAGAQKSR